MRLEDVTLDQIYEFMERGSLTNAPEHIVKYIEMIDKIRGMIYRFDIYGSKEAVIKHIVLVYGFTPYKARQVYEETIEYFYVDVEVSKKAYINFYADKMDRVVDFAMQQMKDVSDASKVIKMLCDIATHREVHIAEKEDLPEGFFDKPVNLMMMDASIFEFGQANRKALDAFIEKIPDITEREKLRIKQEARLLPLKLLPDAQEDPRRT